MWIQVRTIDGKETRTVEDLSRLTKIESLRLKIQDIFNVSPQQQRLFYRGKQVNLSLTVCVTPLCNSRFFLMLWQGLVLRSEWSSGAVAVSDPCELPVSIGIRQQFLRKKPGVHGGPTPEKKLQYYIIVWPHYAAILHCLGLAEKTRMQQMSNRRRHVCLHCRERPRPM